MTFLHYDLYAQALSKLERGHDRDLLDVDEMLTREPRRLPTLSLTEEGRAVTDIHDFRAEHFELTDYDPHPAIKGIPVLT